MELCDQEYVRVSSESGSVAVPSRLTVEPSGTVWSPPASTVGAVFAESVMVTVHLVCYGVRAVRHLQGELYRGVLGDVGRGKGGVECRVVVKR